MSAQRTAVTIDSETELAVRFERAAVPCQSTHARFYELRVQPSAQLTLDGEPSGFDLIVTKGSLGGKRTTIRVESFTTLRAAIERFGHFSTERRRRGYHEAR